MAWLKWIILETIAGVFVGTIFFHYETFYRVSQNKVINKKKSEPKLSAAESNFPIEMTWKRLILLSLSKKTTKKQFSDTRSAGYL